MSEIKEGIDRATVEAAKALETYKYGFTTAIESEKAPKGLSEETIRFISAKKEEPEWLLEWRLEAFRRWQKMEEPDWAMLHYPAIDYQDAYYYAAPKTGAKYKSIEDVPYAKGYIFALDAWREVLAGLDALRNDRGMQVILIAHASVEKFANPETETYDRYAPRLNKHASALIQEWCDEVMFATYRVLTKSTDEGFNRKRVQGVGSGERVLKTTERPAHVAKNRLSLPDELPLDFRVYAAHRDGSVTPETSSPDTSDTPTTMEGA